MFLKKYFDIKETNNIEIKGLTDELISFCVNNIYSKNDRNIIVLTSSLFEANRIYSLLSENNENTYIFPMDEFLEMEALATSPELKSIRLNTLNSISTSTVSNIIVTNLTGLLRYLPSKKIWLDSNISIKINESYNKEQLLNDLINIGYERSSLVTKSGDVSNRGYILDIYPISSVNPIRIEFWGDEIESIREFNVDTQRSIKDIKEVTITPYSEFINRKDKDIPNYQKYLKYVCDDIESIFDYLDNPILIYKDYKIIKESYKRLFDEIKTYSSSKNEEYKTNYMFNLDDIKIKDEIFISKNHDDLNRKSSHVYNFHTNSVDKFSNNYVLLDNYLRIYFSTNKTIIISLKDKKNIRVLKNKLKYDFIETTLDKLDSKKVNIVYNEFSEGFIFNDFVVITEKELFKEKINSNYKSKFKIGTKISIDNIEKGDYVVHLSHGIGIYNGIKTLSKNKMEKDYLEILYKGNDKLYIPVERIDLISKYSSKEGYTPKINKLDSVEWLKTKLRIKNSIKNIADKLIKISAEREMKPGFSFNKDDEDQTLFESEFQYDLTKDQFTAIEKIKEKMESPSPMDMLLCGDVGYGKTEVAFRAMFKAVNSGKQVAYLCPTTILSSQQYKNAIDRFKNFGINIALLNRFTTKKESNEIIKKLQEGKIDIIFGTHRILSKDVIFKDLGLLVVDEEQRFGVMHKERIKELKSTIDVLTLSATPIPRTLQMSLVGIRDLALIETPPLLRHPISTYVLEESESLIKEAIYKELSRNGQIYILFNSVERINEKCIELQKLVPEARIRFAHGKMSKSEIENTMIDFVNYEFDILLCTTIIETGIDIANVNTLIVYDADNFGLSQLYQIRGRVGRSNRIAYAYLLYSKNKSLNDIAVKRLNAIKEFTELGSGFQIAMRDLSIRGAGDILGSEQAGFITSVGYDLYIKLLNDEVSELQGNTTIKEEKNDQPLINVSSHISDSYIEDEQLKIELHKKISEIDSLEKLNLVKEEIKDRFGDIDENLDIYMYSIWFDNLCNLLGIKNINETNLYIEFSLDKSIIDRINVDELFVYANDLTFNFKFTYKNDRLYIKLMFINLEKHYIYYLTDLLNEINSKLV